MADTPNDLQNPKDSGPVGEPAPLLESASKSEKDQKPLRSDSTKKSGTAKTSAKAKSKSASKRSKGKQNKSDSNSVSRPTRSFPASSFEDALFIPNAIQRYAAGQRMRRITLFDQLGKSPESSGSRQSIINAFRYGLLTTSYRTEYLELTPDGFTATSSEVTPREKLVARFRLGIEKIEPFKTLYESQKGNRLPATSVLEDAAIEFGVPKENARECVETFIVNAKYLGVLKTLAGAERVISLEQALDDLPRIPIAEPNGDTAMSVQAVYGGENLSRRADPGDMAQICFYISPIGDADSEHRRHADLFLGSIVEPALEEFGLTVVRADKIGKPGMITSQILEYILKAKLVVADLSFHNPNVFYELALRHVCRLPTVQIIRSFDPIPFDLDHFRTIQIDTTDIYSLVPNLQSYKAEISTQVRAVLHNAESVDNPISTYYPDLIVRY